MNKSMLIVLLAICLVSVHAFVKRDTAATNDNGFDAIKKNLEDFAENIKKTFEDNVNADSIKKSFTEVVDKVNEAFKPKTN